jgi:hypothetical protein
MKNYFFYTVIILLFITNFSNTPIFDETFKPGSEESIRIINRFGAESSGRTVGSGTPNVQAPVGKPCN